jgi:hypothetical protein
MNARILNLAKISLLAAAAVLLAGCNNKGSSPETAPSSSAGRAITSAEKNSFNEVTAKLDKGGNFYLYLSTEQALGKLSQAIATYSNVFTQLPTVPEMGRERIARVFEVINNVIKDSGVEHISGLGISSIAREPGLYYNKFILHHYAGQNDGALWTAFGKAAHPLKELNLLPENTAFAAYGDLDIPLIWQTVEKELKQLQMPQIDQALAQIPDQFKAAVGLSLDDLLNSLGGGYGLIFTLDESQMVALPIPTMQMQIPEPALAIFAKVKNDAIFNRIDELKIPMIVKTQVNGVNTLSLTLPIQLPIHLKPTLARVGDCLFLTSSDGLLQEIMAVQSGKKSGYKSTDEFKKLSQGVPAEGNSFTLMSAKFGKSLTQAVQGMMSAQSGAMGAAESKMLHDTMASMMASNSAAFSYSVAANGAEGWESSGNGNKSMATAAVLVPAVAVGGMLAAIAIPNFVRARTTSQHNACINNLRIIDAAKQQWALEYHKKATDIPTAQDITPYMGRGPAGQFPVCPEGGTYIIGAVGEKPRCSIPGHELP